MERETGTYTLAGDIRAYVGYCAANGYVPDAFSFASLSYPHHKHVSGREIDELLAKELAKNEQRN